MDEDAPHTAPAWAVMASTVVASAMMFLTIVATAPAAIPDQSGALTPPDPQCSCDDQGRAVCIYRDARGKFDYAQVLPRGMCAGKAVGDALVFEETVQ